MEHEDIERQPVIKGREGSLRRHWTSLSAKVTGSEQVHDKSVHLEKRGHTPTDLIVAETRGHNRATNPILPRHRAIDILFGLDADFVRDWPGSLLFCGHLERSSLVLLEHKYDVIWAMIGSVVAPNGHECWKWYLAILSAIQKLPQERITIDGICLQIALDNDFPTTHGSAQLSDTQLDEARRAIFAVLCWISASLIPVLARPVASASISETPASLTLPDTWVEASGHMLSRNDYKRPVAKIFRGFRANVTTSDVDDHEAMPSRGTRDALFESSITYVSLYRIGHVRLKLVDTITEHLQFDRQRRTLSLFRFPTYCIMSILPTKKLSLMEDIISELLSQRVEYTTQNPAHAHREVLLSYRLLFAQSSQSRALMKQYLNQLRRDHEDIDPFLAVLCITPLASLRNNRSLPKDIFPYSTLDLDGVLKESDTYSATDDFPVFGSRLQSLQRYNMRQQPSKVKDLWRDRRNPLQWYTFWTVLWVGGASIILSVLQLGVGIAQLYYAVTAQP